MSPETQKALEDFAMQIIEAAKTGTAWTVEQTPLLVQEWLHYQYIATLLDLALPVGFLVLIWAAALWIVPSVVRRTADKPYRITQADEPTWRANIATQIRWTGVAIASFVTLMIVDIGIQPNIQYLIKLHVAPRVVVFEKFLSIIK